MLLQLTRKAQATLESNYSGASLTTFWETHQPQFEGEILTLAELLDFAEYSPNQEPVNENKVKAILTRIDSGLFYTNILFNPIVIGLVDEDAYIVSGRHRAHALKWLADYFGVSYERVQVKVLYVEYPKQKHITQAIVAFNTNRTMNKTERDVLDICAETDGYHPHLWEVATNRTTFTKNFGRVFVDCIGGVSGSTDFHVEYHGGLIRNNIRLMLDALAKHIYSNYPKEAELLMSQESYGDACEELIQFFDENIGVFDYDGKGNFQRDLKWGYCERICQAWDTFKQNQQVTEDQPQRVTKAKQPRVTKDKQPQATKAKQPQVNEDQHQQANEDQHQQANEAKQPQANEDQHQQDTETYVEGVTEPQADTPEGLEPSGTDWSEW